MACPVRAPDSLTAAEHAHGTFDSLRADTPGKWLRVEAGGAAAPRALPAHKHSTRLANCGVSTSRGQAALPDGKDRCRLSFLARRPSVSAPHRAAGSEPLTDDSW